jgi:hypothetical protein
MELDKENNPDDYETTQINLNPFLHSLFLRCEMVALPLQQLSDLTIHFDFADSRR